MITIGLTSGELQIAAAVGVLRQLENLGKQRPDAYGAPIDEGWQIHIEGAAGEQAFAKWSNRYWSGNLGNLRAADVGSKVQVRTTRHATGRLILHPDDEKDPPDDVFVLLTGAAPTFCIRGWIYGRDGKTDAYWTDPTGKNRPAFFVPQSALRPMDDRPWGKRAE